MTSWYSITSNLQGVYSIFYGPSIWHYDIDHSDSLEELRYNVIRSSRFYHSYHSWTIMIIQWIKNKFLREGYSVRPGPPWHHWAGGRGGDFTKKSQACISLTERANTLQVLRFNPTVWDNEHHWVLTEINSLVWLEGLLGDVIRSKMSARLSSILRLGVVWPLLALESHNEGKHFQNNNRITLHYCT